MIVAWNVLENYQMNFVLEHVEHFDSLKKKELCFVFLKVTKTSVPGLFFSVKNLYLRLPGAVFAVQKAHDRGLITCALCIFNSVLVHLSSLFNALKMTSMHMEHMMAPHSEPFCT